MLCLLVQAMTKAGDDAQDFNLTAGEETHLKCDLSLHMLCLRFRGVLCPRLRDDDGRSKGCFSRSCCHLDALATDCRAAKAAAAHCPVTGTAWGSANDSIAEAG